MKIKNARIKAGLTQSELAELSKIPIRVIRSFEQGTRNINKTNVTYVIMLCYTLKCKLEDILEDEEVVKMLNEIYKK
jgi:transcriptional regulator with XRE-family HTH domain